METEGEYHVSDAPRPWPNNAANIRDRAAEEAVHGIRALLPIFDEDWCPRMSDVERLRREAVALNCLQTIARLLESVGAQTRP